jgi:hypothetical protein
MRSIVQQTLNQEVRHKMRDIINLGDLIYVGGTTTPDGFIIPSRLIEIDTGEIVA